MKDILNLNEILSRASKPVEPGSGKAHFLFLLGTDTEFTAKPTKNDPDPIKQKYFQRGETLSYMAQLTTAALKEQGEAHPNSSLSYSSASVEVLNGPTTFGTEVGDRIAKAVLLALRAAASGKETLQISAHSRGAVEAIIVMHELKRIQEALRSEPQKSLKDILLDTPCTYTKKAYQAVDAGEEASAESKTALQQRLANLKIHSFLIDPVPGGRFFGTPYVRWVDPRFYKPLPAGNHCLILKAHERSRCFIPIVPEGTQPIALPGHHGTASGNIFDQQFREPYVGLANKDTSAVQDLVILKMLQDFQKHTGLFNEAVNAFPEGHQDILNPLVANFLAKSPQERDKEMLLKYQSILKNRAAYEKFTLSGYAYLGTEKTADGHRYVHHLGHNYRSLDEVCPAVLGRFVNLEHAKLYLVQQGFPLPEDNLKAYQQMEQIRQSLRNLINAMEGQNKQSDPLLKLAVETTTSPLFKDALNSVVDAIAQKYINNHISSEDKSLLLQSLVNLFRLMSDQRENNAIIPAYRSILEAIEQSCKERIGLMLEQSFKNLVQNSRQFQQQIQYTVVDRQSIINETKEELRRLAVTKPQINRILGNSETGSLENCIEAYMQELTASDLESRAKEDALAEIRQYSDRLSAYNQATQLDTVYYLKEAEQLVTEIDGISAAYKALRIPLAKELDIDLNHLQVLRSFLLQKTGEYLKAKNYDLRRIPDGVTKEFFEIVKKQAIAAGSPCPEKQALEQKIACLLSKEGQDLALIIQKKLIPMTEHYLRHLASKAKVTQHNLEDELPVKDSDDAAAYQQLKTKYEKVRELYRLLKNTNDLPSDTIRNFQASLLGAAADISIYRDKAWKKYCKACFAVLALCVTGIIPGLLVLGAYAMKTKRSILFFLESHGKRYEDDCKKVLEDPAKKGP